jgi:hypothetical protein
MAATVTSRELFPKTGKRSDVEAQQALEIKAGAISSSIDDSDPTNWVLVTVWNVIGQNA